MPDDEVFEKTVDDPVPGLPIRGQGRPTRVGLPPLAGSRKRTKTRKKRDQKKKREKRQRQRENKRFAKIDAAKNLRHIRDCLDDAEVFDPGHTYLFFGSKGTKMSLKEWRHRSYITG